MERETLKSRLGFILLSAGCAIGIGNVWKFPYIAGQGGGGAFVLFYLVFLVILGLPIMTMEFAVGRASRKSPVRAYQALEKPGQKWHIHGYLTLIGCYLLMMFYTTVAGWMLHYFYMTAIGQLSGLNAEQVAGKFTEMLASPGVMTFWMVFVVVLGILVCAKGLQNGLERVTKVMMIALLAIMVVLAVNSLFMPGAKEGLKFYLVPDFSRMQEVGVVNTLVSAMNQAFFTLSLGIGAMAIFGSYIGKEHSLLGESVRIATAHGKMDQEQLGDIMSQMTDGELDILVCTTIIETGIDLPNVNTLIIENAETFGLAQLHQLRGRVGRSTRRAAAYLTYRPSKVLTEDQSKRLSAIREYAAFGSGFKIAMRDLEIRGAGNLLGPEQSGFLMSVGYDLYLRLLEEAVLEEQGKPVVRETLCTADFAVAAAIPERYIPAPEQRMDLYRRIARVRTQEEGDDITDELIDRYGDPPVGVANLIAIALLRARAAALGITELVQKEGSLRFSLPQPDFAKVAAVCGLEKYKGRLLFSAGDKPYLSLRLKKGDDVLKLAGIVLRDFEAAG